MIRRLTIVAMFLLAGAVVNVVVAWGCAAWRLGLQRVGDVPPLKSQALPRMEALWQIDRPEIYAHQLEDWDELASFGRRTTRLFNYPDVNDPWLYERCIERSGWPLLALEGYIWGRLKPLATKKDPEVLFDHGVRNPLSDAVGAMLPLRPIWPGFAINTLFYTTLLWLLILGPFTVRRFLRVRRGICPKCAYPTGDSPSCTECGVELPTRSRTMK